MRTPLRTLPRGGAGTPRARRLAAAYGLGSLALSLFVAVAALPPAGRAAAAGPPPGGPAGPRAFALLFTADTNGYLQACGCTANQVGGLAKRATLLKQLREEYRRRGVATVLLDGGNLAKDADTTAAVLAGMRRMGYQGVAAGTLERLAGGSFLAEAARQGVPAFGFPVPAPGPARGPRARGPECAPFLVLRAGGFAVGVVSLGAGGRAGAAPARAPSAAAVGALLDRVRRRAGVVIAFSDLDAEQETRLVSAPPVRGRIDLLVSRAGPPGGRPTSGVGGVVPVGDHGAVGAVEAVIGAAGRPVFAWRFEPVSDSLPGDDGVAAVVSAYYARQERSLIEASQRSEVDWTKLGYEPAPTCVDCHREAGEKWAGAKHAKAAATLRDRGRLVGSCLTCHSELYRRTGRFNPTLAAAWEGVTCTTCHGDGIVHSALRSRDSIRRRVPESQCRTCHDPQNDPKFDYATYLEKIRHW